MTSWLIAVAAAANPGAFRVGPMLPVSQLALRDVYVPGVGPSLTKSSTLVGRFGADPYSVSVELPLLLAFGEDWVAGGIGRPKMGWYVHPKPVDDDVRMAVGLEVATVFPVDGVRAPFWGTHQREVTYGTEGVLVLGLSTLGDAPFVFRVGAGLMGGRRVDWLWLFNWTPVGDVSVSKILPVSDLLAVVGEAELQIDTTPISARLMARLGDGPATVDVGIQGVTPGWGLPLPSLVMQLTGTL